MKKEEIYQYLINNLTLDNLKEVTMKIIDAYKNKNIELLQSYAEHIKIDHHDFKDNSNRLFLKLIKYFHPDMLNNIQKDIELSFNKNQMGGLEFYKNILSAEKKIKIPGSTKSQRTSGGSEFKYARDEKYQFDTRDFGYSVSGSYDDTGDAIIDEVAEELDFINALKAAYMGNNDLYPGIADLGSIEEELVLCDYGISDLNELQHFVNITSLNLSYNVISSIYEIKYLSELQKLVLSNNC